MTSLCPRSYYWVVPERIERNAELRMDTGLLRVTDVSQEHAGNLEIVVPFTGSEMTAKVMKAAAAMVQGLNASIKLVAVYVAPYPAELRCPAATEAHLAARLGALAHEANLSATVYLVVARDRDTAFRRALRPRSAVLLGTRKRIWRTREEALARELRRDGHLVSLLHFA